LTTLLAEPTQTTTTGPITAPSLAEIGERALALAQREWGRRPDVEDLAQRATIKYWETFGETEQPLGVTSWLRSTLRRLAIDEHRREVGRHRDGRARKVRPYAPSDIERAFDLMATSPSMIAIRRELMDRVHLKLTGRDAVIFRARVAGTPADQVADRFGISRAAVDQAYARAKRRLRQALADDPQLERDLRGQLATWPVGVRARLSDPSAT